MAKPVEFCGTALNDLRTFPASARREAGYQIDRVQHGYEPLDWKPMNTVGPGALEIRIRSRDGSFRVVYVAKFAEAIYVLHCFRKSTAKTSDADIAIARRRYSALANQRRHLKLVTVRDDHE